MTGGIRPQELAMMSTTPSARTLLALLAVLLNTLLPVGWSMAAPTGNPIGDSVLCLASGGTVTAPATGEDIPADSTATGGHCKICPLPLANALPSAGAARLTMPAAQKEKTSILFAGRLVPKKPGLAPIPARGPPA